MYRGPIKSVGISDITDESDYAFKVRLEISGKEIWISRQLIIQAVPGAVFVPEWYYKKHLAELEEVNAEVPF